MNEKIRINYTYYNNPELLQEVIQYYEPYSNEFDFSVIDDGSQIHPLTKDMLPDNWIGYRIEEDLGWGNEVARNILMRRTSNTWNALLDLDIVIDLSEPGSLHFFGASTTSISGFVKYFHNYRGCKLVHQFPYGARTDYFDFTKEITGNAGNFAINSFIVSRESWQETYGYDMVFAYTYGMDATLVANNQEAMMPFGKLKKLCNQAVPDMSRILNQSVYQEFYDLYNHYIESGEMIAELFKWKSEDKRLKYIKPFPDVVDL
jgi:hypothetical protein